MILELSITVFLTQLIFIGTRTWNVRAVAAGHMGPALLSGVFIHLSWLVSIAIGAHSTIEILQNWKLEYLPVVVCSLSGGLLGTFMGLYKKKNNGRKNSID